MKLHKKIAISGLLTLTILTAIPQPSTYAVEVHDGTLISVTKDGLADQLKNTLNNLQTLEAALKNLESLKGEAITKNLGNIKTTLNDLKKIRNEANGLPLDFNDLQSNWDNIYTDYKSVNGLSAQDYYDAYKESSTNVDDSIKNAMMAQGLISQLDKDADVLEVLINNSNSADGALKATQIGNQMTAMLIQNMMRLEQIIGMSERSQSDYLLKQQQRIEASNASNRGNGMKFDTKLKGKGL